MVLVRGHHGQFLYEYAGARIRERIHMYIYMGLYIDMFKLQAKTR